MAITHSPGNTVLSQHQRGDQAYWPCSHNHHGWPTTAVYVLDVAGRYYLERCGEVRLQGCNKSTACMAIRVIRCAR